MKKRFDAENYVKVNERVAKFREEHQEGSIHTNREPDLHDGEGGYMVRFKALIFRDQKEVELYGKCGIAPATGHAELYLDGDKVTEKCETIAIGRALAILGYEVQHSIASEEEMDSYEENKARTSLKSRRNQDEDEEEEAPRKSRKFAKNDDEDGEAEDSDEDSEPKPRRSGGFRNIKRKGE